MEVRNIPFGNAEWAFVEKMAVYDGVTAEDFVRVAAIMRATLHAARGGSPVAGDIEASFAVMSELLGLWQDEGLQAMLVEASERRAADAPSVKDRERAERFSRALSEMAVAREQRIARGETSHAEQTGSVLPLPPRPDA